MPDIDRNKRKRRSYSNKFKAEVVAHCLAGDESIASISMQHDINQNLVHRWVTEHRRYGKHDLSQFDEPKNKLPGPITPSNWVEAVPSSSVLKKHYTPQPQKKKARPSATTIGLQISGKDCDITIQWPLNQIEQLAQFTKAVMT